MKVYTTDGTVIECGGYKAVRAGGVVLTKDKKRKKVIGYVPNDHLNYILPDDTEPAGTDAEVSESDESAGEPESDSSDEDTDASDDEDEDEGGEHGGEAADTDEERERDESVIAAEIASDEIGVAEIAEAVELEAHTHTDLEERIEDHELRIDTLEGRVDEFSTQLERALEAAEEEPYDPEALTNIRGIGSAYAARLRDSGVETITELLAAPIDELVAATDVSERRVEEWHERAEEHVERELTNDDSEEATEEDEE